LKILEEIVFWFFEDDGLVHCQHALSEFPQTNKNGDSRDSQQEVSLSTGVLFDGCLRQLKPSDQTGEARAAG